MPDEQDASIEWLQGHVRDAAQETFRCFAHIGSEHVDQVARSVLTDPASYESSSNGVLPCVKSHAQLASLMVKYSFANRLRHLSRALPKEVVGDVLEDVEKLTVATYEGLLGDDLHFDEILSRRVILPNRLGGIAMRTVRATVERLLQFDGSHGERRNRSDDTRSAPHAA